MLKELLLDNFLYFIIFIKFIFITSAVAHVYLTHKATYSKKVDNKIVYWKERTEFVFIISMSLLLIYHFNPRNKQSTYINSETSLLFFLFGWALILTAKWSLFIQEAPWYKRLMQNLV
jgi:hypothetical protein